MKIQVLGPLILRMFDIDVVPTARKPRQVLSLLLMNENRPVSVTSLFMELWDDSPPKSAATTLQTYILHLRRLLARACDVSQAEVTKEWLRTCNSGYMLLTPHGESDLHRYRQLEQAGARSFQISDYATASELFNTALDLWRGPLLMDVEHGRMLRAEAARWEQSKLTMTEQRIDAELCLGRHREVLSELASLVIRHRFQESLHAQFIVALHRSGYRSRALEVFSQLRASMIDELGLEPSAKLRQLHQAVLISSPELDETTGIPSGVR